MVTDLKDICAICGGKKQETHHLIFGRGLRELADEDFAVIPLCKNCHKQIHMNGTASALSKMLGQMYWEKEAVKNGESAAAVREKFISRYGRSYL